jgi:hypothetical protein
LDAETGRGLHQSDGFWGKGRAVVVAQLEKGTRATCTIAAGKQQVLRFTQDDKFLFGRDGYETEPKAALSED